MSYQVLQVGLEEVRRSEDNDYDDAGDEDDYDDDIHIYYDIHIVGVTGVETVLSDPGQLRTAS